MTQEPELPEYLSPQAMADLLDVSAGTVRDWIRAGRLEARRFGPRLLRIHREEALRFLRGDQQKDRQQGG